MEASEQRDASHAKPTDSCFDKTFSSLTVDDVYEIAKLIGADVEKLIDGYGKESVVGLVPKIVKVLELLESLLNKSNSRRQAQAREANQTGDQKDPDQPCFTKKEVRDIIFERNELKTNLFLLQEELNYYQRYSHWYVKILNEERCPGFLLEAVRSAIKKKRKLIKAKMLGIPVNECSNRSPLKRHTLSSHRGHTATLGCSCLCTVHTTSCTLALV
uniref:RILP-like protein 2 n=1 Tax=Neogobius melanostomus TaxID=47308 RepID=A0A8C6SGJ8_9GOBI